MLTDWQSWILPAFLGILVLVMMRHWRGVRERLEDGRREEGASKLSDLAAARFERPSLADSPLEADRWRVEMHETARQLKAELDTKMVALQVLIRDAQAQADRLEQAIAVVQRSAAKSLDGELSQSARPRPALFTADQRSQVYRLADLGRSAATIADQLHAPLGDVELLLSLRTRG
jgi:hypothetical protein